MSNGLNELTRLVEELTLVLEQSRNTQCAVKQLAEQVVEAGVPELPAVEITEDSRNALEYRIELQQASQLRQDALSTIETISMLVGSVRDALYQMRAQRESASDMIKEAYMSKIEAQDEILQGIKENHRKLLAELVQKRSALTNLRDRIVEPAVCS